MKRDWNPNEPEMMDRPQPVTPELERDLQNLRGLNQHFGSYHLVRHFLRRWLNPGGSYRVLDLCTGFADIPRMMLDWARSQGIQLKIDAVDFQPATLEIARKHSGAYPEIRFLQADAREFTPPEGSVSNAYDLVCCSLALHHFSEADAVQILRRALLLGSVSGESHVLVADLDRSWLTSAAIELITATLYRDPMTRYDARMSARRAFSFSELDALARQAGWHQFDHKRFRPCRQAIWV